MLLPAVIGIVSFALAMLSNNYYQAPMGIIGKVYANSMLGLINSRMLLGSEEEPLAIISAIRFDAAPANDSTAEISQSGQDLRELQGSK